MGLTFSSVAPLSRADKVWVRNENKTVVDHYNTGLLFINIYIYI